MHVHVRMTAVVAESKRRLTAAGFSELNMKESWKVQPSGKVRRDLDICV